jgi:hypothetical protein
VDRSCAHALLPKKLGHEIRVVLGHTKCHRALATVLSHLLECVLGAGFDGDAPRQLFLVKAGVSPGDIVVVDLVRHAVVSESAEETLLDSFDKIAPVDEVSFAQVQEVPTVCPLWRGGEAQKELRAEVVDQSPVCVRCGVVKLIHDDVIKGVPVESEKVLRSSQSLD